MQNTKLNKEGRVQYWREIILRAEQHPVSCHAFCLAEGISQASFYSWRDKLSKHHSSQEIKSLARVPSVFAEVHVKKADLRTTSQQPLIDAKWVAELILHLHGGLR